MVLNRDDEVAYVGRYAGWDEADGLMVLVQHDLPGMDNPARLAVHAVVPFDPARLPAL
jgi:hypothetical protein